MDKARKPNKSSRKFILYVGGAKEGDYFSRLICFSVDLASAGS
jgi:hypothetical protein